MRTAPGAVLQGRALSPYYCKPCHNVGEKRRDYTQTMDAAADHVLLYRLRHHRGRRMSEGNNEVGESVLWKSVCAVAIGPERAMAIVEQYQSAARKSNPTADDVKIEKIVSQKVIKKYARTSALSGAVTALPGIVPGIGTAVAVAGGGLTDAVVSLKAQMDMTLVLAAVYGWDITEQDARHMALLIALCGGLEKLGEKTVTPIASKAGVKMLKMYLKGGALTTIKSLTRSFGVTFSRKALEKSIPFGIGAVIGTTVNYGLTLYVGKEAVKCFLIEREAA